jgi:hypothetical protein
MATEMRRDGRTNVGDEAAGAVEAAAVYGLDIAQLRDNLALTVTERLRRHQMALDTVELLQKAKRPPLGDAAIETRST